MCTDCPSAANAICNGQGKCSDGPPSATSTGGGTCTCEVGYTGTSCQNQAPCDSGYGPGGTGTERCSKCKPGKFSANGLGCNDCEAGTYNNIEMQSTCSKCTRGTAAGYVGLTTCTTCEAGKFADNTGMAVCTECVRNFFVAAEGATVCTSCPAQATTLSTGTKGFAECLCSPPAEYVMRNGKCHGCPTGAQCGGGGEVKPKAGNWIPAGDKAGELKAKITVGLPYAIYGQNAAVWAAIRSAMESLTLTGTGSVTISSVVAVMGSGFMEIRFDIVVPVGMAGSDVNTLISNSMARRTLSFATLLTTSLAATTNVSVTNITTGGYAPTAEIVEPVAASSHKSYSCPFPKNCIPADNSSVCAEGATGPVCAICQPGYKIEKDGCKKCADEGGSVEFVATADTLIFYGIVLLLLGTCTYYIVREFVDFSSEEEINMKLLLLVLDPDFLGPSKRKGVHSIHYQDLLRVVQKLRHCPEAEDGTETE